MSGPTGHELPGPLDPFPEHLAAIARGQEGAVGGFVRALLAQEVWEAWRSLPPGVEPGTTVTLAAPMDISVLGSELPDGSRGLAVFGSESGVHARAAEAVPVRRRGADVLRPILDGEPGLGGLVFDPAGPVYQVLTAEWVRDGAAGRI
jgi:hypothetical protein